MGLDITACRRAKRVGDNDHDTLGGNLENAYINPDFSAQADGLTSGLFEIDDPIDFRAGSYGGYNRWREELARLAGYPETYHESSYGPPRMLCAAACWSGATGPFSELINFSDAEGVIGPVTAGNLARDFAEWDARARAHQSGLEEWFYEAYCQWRRAFELAADGGFVQFH